MSEFTGLVAAVTGGSSGIGAATAALLAGNGATVIVLDRNEPSSGQRFLMCDITDERDIHNATSAIERELGQLDILVNNAGVGAVGDVTANNRDEWHRVFDVNVISMARLTAEAMPLLARSSHASVVNVASVVARIGVRDRALYSASKGAVVSLTFAMAADLVEKGIRVNCVAPGTSDTPWVARLLSGATDPEAAAVALRARQPIGRLVTADEVAHAITYLCSPLSASTTGTVVSVDGGMGSIR